MTGVRLQLLGRFQVRRDGEEVPPAAFGGRKVRTLLRVLAVHGGDLVPHDVLADAVWPQRLPADPAGNLGVLVNRARRALGDPAVVVTGSGGYALGGCAVDVTEFLTHLGAARYAAALALWGEPLPEDAYADWATGPRDRLRRAHVEACEGAARSALARGAPAEATRTAAEAVAADPLRESSTVLLAEALAACGDRAGAVSRLDELCRALATELGVAPSDEVVVLRERLARRGVGVPAPGGPPRSAPVRASVAGLAFVGRDDELDRLRAAVDAGRVVGLAGAAGTGKSRLLAELGRALDVPVVAAQAYLAERDEAWGLARSVLREALLLDAGIADALPARTRGALAELLPELSCDDVPAALDGESRRALVLAGGLRILEAAGAPLIVDDLQWADPSSLALLGSVLARVPTLPAVLAFRPAETGADVLDRLRQARGLPTLALRPLAAAALGGLVDDPELLDALAAGTDRTPFAVGEVLRGLAAAGAVVHAQGRWRPAAPDAADRARELGRAGQRRGIARRAARHRGVAADLLALVAIARREVPARVVASAAGTDARDVLDTLAALAADGLLRLGEAGWTTAHDLVAETVADGLDRADRGRLHALLARALADDGADPAEVARHHRDAGDSRAAAEAYGRAATAALDAHATREAAALADAGLALQPAADVAAVLLEARGAARVVHGDIDGAAADLRAALTGPGPDRSRRRARLAMLSSGARDPQAAADLAELALVEAGDDAGARALALETAAVLDVNLGHTARAADRAEEALAVYRRLGDAQGVARILDGRAMAVFLDGRIAEAVALFGRVADLFAGSGDLLRVVTPRSTRGHGLVFLGRPADGLDETDAALRLARDLDSPEGVAYACWHRSEALSALGRTDEAEAAAHEALTVARSLGHRGWTATAHRALGIALQTRGDLDGAAAEFTESALVAGDSLTLFASWAAARLAQVALAQGRDATAHIARARSIGPPLGHREIP
ncbi:BTAD domain-containing putative transcriptional regulator [Pseudonocardia sp.]|uniref:BTAD domain-containing putative transcriptional regulator n=1 Tax=Pseudonocardia sp. TaxID=60912 RepID=UPI003D0ACFB0